VTKSCLRLIANTLKSSILSQVLLDTRVGRRMGLQNQCADDDRRGHRMLETMNE